MSSADENNLIVNINPDFNNVVRFGFNKYKKKTIAIMMVHHDRNTRPSDFY